MEKLLRDKNVYKKYIAKVKGKFPRYMTESQKLYRDEIICEEPILTIDHKLSLNAVSSKGKESKTSFKLIRYSPKEDCSIVECEPLTGRTHQIRVHLKHLGYPILNDPLYNPEFIPITLDPAEGTCEVCHAPNLPDPAILSIFLHAFSYHIDGVEYVSELPLWVKD